MPFLKSPSAPAQRKSVPIIDMTGGTDLSTDAFQVDSRYLLGANNVDPMPGGGVAMRRTVSPMHSDNLASKPVSLEYFARPAGQAAQLLVGLETGELRYITSVEGEIGPSSQILAGGTNRPWTGVQVNDKFYLQDGNATPRRWNGSTLTTLGAAYNGTTWSPSQTYTGGNMPVARLMALGHSRLWAVIGAQKLAWSYPLTLEGGAEDWGSEDFVLCDPIGESDITAIVWAADRLFVFQEHATFQVLGFSPATFQLFAISTKHGAAGPRSIATDGTRVFAWDSNAGLHIIAPTSNGGSGSDEGAVFRPMARLIRDSRIAEPGAPDTTVGHVNDRVYVSLTLDGRRQTLALDLQIGSWTVYDLQLGDYEYFSPGGRATPVACSWRSAWAYRVLALDGLGDTDSDGMGAHTVSSFFTTAWLHDNLPTQAKRWFHTDFIMDAGAGQSIVPFVAYDWDAGTAVALGTVQSDASDAAPFVMPTSAMVDLEYERLTPDADPTPRPWQSTPGADVMTPSAPKTTRRRVRMPALEASSVSYTIYGPTPSKRWSVRAIVPTYALSRRPL